MENVFCPRCQRTVEHHEPDHIHRVTVRVPIERVVDGRRVPSFDRVGVMVDVFAVDAAIQRAVVKVHGARAFWWSGHGEPDRGQVMRWIQQHQMSTSLTGRMDAPVVEWQGVA